MQDQLNYCVSSSEFMKNQGQNFFCGGLASILTVEGALLEAS